MIESTAEEKKAAIAQIRRDLRSQLATMEIAKTINATVKDEKAVLAAVDSIKAIADRLNALDVIEKNLSE